MANAIEVPNIAKPESCLYGIMTTQLPRQMRSSNAASLVLLLVWLYWAAQAATLTTAIRATQPSAMPFQ
jgi:hypothetical protein